MTIRAKEDSLFQSWRTSRPAFAADGVVSEQDYHASSPSIVVILKEVNDPDGGNWDLRQFLRDGGRSQRTMSRGGYTGFVTVGKTTTGETNTRKSPRSSELRFCGASA